MEIDMEAEEALAGEYVTAMLATVALWIASIVAGVAIGGYLALSELGL